MEELKPCPFCGEIPELAMDDDDRFDVYCTNLKCEMEVTLKRYSPTKKEAVKIWNRRAGE